MFSNNSYEVLVLTTTVDRILENGDENEIDEAIRTYEVTGVIPSILLTTPSYINVSLSECPTLILYLWDASATLNFAMMSPKGV